MLEGECVGEFRHDLLNGGQHAFGEETVIIEDRTNAKRYCLISNSITSFVD